MRNSWRKRSPSSDSSWRGANSSPSSGSSMRSLGKRNWSFTRPAMSATNGLFPSGSRRSLFLFFWFMTLMRHEAAHAYSYAYQLYKKKKWQEAFGLASTEETEFYRPRPYSRSYVMHLDDWYAQSHPDEDFAETFAIWLTPELDWRKRYAGWK